MTDARSPSPDLLERTQRNLVLFHWLSLREGPRPRRRDWPEATALGSFLPTEVTNTLFVHRSVPDVARLIAEAREFFREAPAWRVSAPSSLRAAIEPAALAGGFRPVDGVPRMILAPLPAAPPTPAGLVIRRVTTPSELREFCAASGRGFRIPAWYLRVAFRGEFASAVPGSPTVRMFVGYEHGRPVATSAHVTSDGVTGIFFVTAVPEVRRRGFGGALTWAAIEDGRSLGAEAAWLQSTPMGRPLYERIGFRWVMDDLDWVASPTRFGRLRILLRVLSFALAPGRGRTDAPG